MYNAGTVIGRESHPHHSTRSGCHRLPTSQTLTHARPPVTRTQMDTLTSDRFAGASRWHFDGRADMRDNHAFNCKGVVRLRGLKSLGRGNRYAVETYLPGTHGQPPSWDSVVSLLLPDVRERLAPDAVCVPWRNPFVGEPAALLPLPLAPPLTPPSAASTPRLKPSAR